MLLADLVDTVDAVAATRSRLAKIDALASALRLLAHHSATVAQQRAVPQQDTDPEERAARTLEDFIRRVRPAAFAALPRPGGEDGPAA